MCTDVVHYIWEDPNRKQGPENWNIEALILSPETFREREREREGQKDMSNHVQVPRQ